MPIPRWNFLQNIRIWSQYAPDSLGKFNGSWLHSTATSDRVIFLGYFNNGTFLSNQMAIAYLPMKPFDEPGNYEYDLINFDNIYLIEKLPLSRYCLV